jgi:acetylglutamate kinase
LKLVIKIGGTLIDTAENRLAIAGKLAATSIASYQTVVVHGGGKQLSHYLKEHGIESEFRGGFRVTPPPILDAVIRTLAGVVNHRLIAALQQKGVHAVGLSGIDAGLVQARQLSPALGAVGEVEKVDASLIELLSANGYLPTVACMAGGRDGAIFNVNADQMAVAVAGAFEADQLIFLTDVHGVLDENKQRLPRLTSREALKLIETGVAHGGMEAKLRAAVAGIAKGIPEVRIVAGAEPDVLARLLAGQQLGTTLVAH